MGGQESCKLVFYTTIQTTDLIECDWRQHESGTRLGGEERVNGETNCRCTKGLY